MLSGYWIVQCCQIAVLAGGAQPLCPALGQPWLNGKRGEPRQRERPKLLAQNPDTALLTLQGPLASVAVFRQKLFPHENCEGASLGLGLPVKFRQPFLFLFLNQISNLSCTSFSLPFILCAELETLTASWRVERAMPGGATEVAFDEALNVDCGSFFHGSSC